MPRTAPSRVSRIQHEGPASQAPRPPKWPPWHWPWWLVLIALQIPLLGLAFLLGALSTMAAAGHAIGQLRHTLILGSPHAIANATHAHGVWMTRVLLVAIGVGMGVLLGRKFHGTRVRADGPIDVAAPQPMPKSAWRKELLVAMLWAGTVIVVGYLVVRTGSHLGRLSLKQL